MAGKSAFGSAFGGAMGCFFGILVAIGLTMGGCAMMMGSCAVAVNEAVKDTNKKKQQQERQNAKASAKNKKSNSKSQKTAPKKNDDEAEPDDNDDTFEQPTQTDLIVEDWNFVTEHGFAKVAGLVKNTSGESIQNVQAVVTFKTSSGGFVKTATALIEYNPILVNQTSPFEVLTPNNPAIQTASVSFSTLFGKTITSQTRETYNAPQRKKEAEAAARRAEEERKRQAEERERQEAERKRQEEKRQAELEARFRTWTSADGKYTTEARLSIFSQGVAHLVTREGKKVKVPYANLSAEDQEFLNDWKKKGEELEREGK